jgi:hypothetical protein
VAGATGTLLDLLFMPLVRHWDLLVFLTAGRDVAAGHDPYPALGSPQLYDGHQFVYPYLTALPFAGLDRLPAGLVFPLYYAASVAAVGLACWLLRPGRPVAVLFVTAASVTVIGLQMGTVNPFLLLAVAVAWRYRERAWAVAVAVGVAVELKVFLLPLLAWLLLAGRYRAALATTAVTALLAGAGWLAGPLGPVGYVRLLGELSGHEDAQGSSLQAVLRGHGLGPTAATAGAVLAGAGLLAAAWWGWRRGGDERLPFGTALVVCLLLSPIVWMHYFLLLAAVPLLVAADAAGVAAVFMAVSWLVVRPHHVTLNHVQHVTLGVLAVVLLLAGAAAELVAHRPARAVRWRRIAAAGGVLLFAGALLAPGNGNLPPLIGTAAVLVFLWTRVSLRAPDRSGQFLETLSPDFRRLAR